MVDNSPPSKNPADNDVLGGALRFIIKKQLQITDDMMPAKVISYDRITNTATIQPLIQLVNTNNVSISRPQYANIPVFAYGGGGIAISFPLQPDDLGWIKANDRDISLYIQAQSEAEPNTDRLHSFRDAMFYPDAMRKIVVAGEDEDAAVIQLLDGSAKISIHRTGQIKIVATTTIDIIAPTVNYTADINITGNIASTGTVTNNGINIGSTHTHPESSGGDTGPPE